MGKPSRKSARNTKHRDALASGQIERLAAAANYRPDAIAALWGVSLRKLERLFETEIGKTVEDWAHSLRDARACELLTEGLRSAAIAQTLGYFDAAHFCNDFKKRHRITPREYAIIAARSRFPPPLSGLPASRNIYDQAVSPSPSAF